MKYKMNVFLLVEFKLLALSYLFLGIIILDKFTEAASGLSKCGTVYITISAYYKNSIILNWVENCGPNDVKPYKVHLTKDDIRNKTGYEYLASATCSEHPSGSFRTKTKFYEWDYWNQSKSVNLGFWITSVTADEKVIDARPFRLYPTWMNDNKEKLKSFQIGDLLIPGTHNSGCYNGRGLYANYIYNQEYDIRRQLEAGIRYFDFRIGYYNDEIFYINHDFMWVEPIKRMYYQIMQFLSVSPGEIIVIDYHRFPRPKYWSEDLHRKFLKFTLSILGSKVFIPKHYDDDAEVKGPTMEEIWRSGKNILLTYNNEIRIEYKQLFSQPVAQAWADTLVIFTLKDYLRNTLLSRFRKQRTFVALMAILTPKPLDVALSRNNLRTLSDYVNPEITKWIRDEWRGKVNIVATDYFFGNNLIEVAIDINTTK